jgi:hypothetical protein
MIASQPKQEPTMSRKTLTQSSLLALALGLTALGSTTIPAAALSGLGRAPISPSIGGSHTSATGFLGAGNVLGKAVSTPHATGNPILGNLNAPVHVVGPAALKPGTQDKGTIGNLKTVPPHVVTTPINVGTVGNLKEPPHIPGIKPPPKPPIQVDNVCPFNKFKCPPQGQNGPTTTQNPAWNPTMPGGVTGPMDGNVPVFGTAPAPVLGAPIPTNAPPAPGGVVAGTPSAEPCNCLTKQYLDDGSVLFRDICTKEAAIATPAELKAQAAAR